jgi:hypothetical protein
LSLLNNVLERITMIQEVAFIHVPKCAGSSLKVVFSGWFGKGLIPHYIHRISGKMPTLLTPEYTNTIANKFGCCCLYGHFNALRGVGVQDNIPHITRFFTILREPFSQFVSEYHYKFDRGRTELDFEEYLATNQPNYLNHFPHQVSFENYREIVDGFEYVGLFEDLKLSMQQLADLLAKVLPVRGLEFRNVGSKSYSDYEWLRAEFEQINHLEVLTYAYAKQKFYLKGA